ncbi:hypothetical protein LTR84_003128 [Exophiala bonariae]|uniref:Uncharacterized protein n=1 Tax=Exophiala bonariae TaxID=1690606 RepID=A0AAV9N7Y4_9EURO|nr:hypothetical protein LTR84_003128 [Exophiala bonariae]
MADSNDNLRTIAVNSETAELASKRNDQGKMGDSYYEDQHSGHNHSANEIQSAKTPTGLFSEHGHSLTQIRPMAKHSGSSVAAFFTGLHTTIIGISSLGASVTFSYVLSNNTQDVPAQSPRFSKEQVQQFLAISWLLFLLGLAFASLGSTLLTFFKSHWIADWDGLNGKNSQWQVQMYAVLASGVMGSLIIGAFIVLGLVVVAYSPIVGWIAVGFTAAFGLFILLAIINQAPWPWRDNTPSHTHRHRTV